MQDRSTQNQGEEFQFNTMANFLSLGNEDSIVENDSTYCLNS